MLNRADLIVMGGADDPAVLLLHPWWGVTGAVRWWAGQLVSAGRRVLVPDFYGGKVAETIEEAEVLQRSMDLRASLSLLDECADELADEHRPWAAMGFSMGAHAACELVGRGVRGPRDLVLFYGGRPPPAGEVHATRVSLHVVDDDEYFTQDELAATSAAFRAKGAVVETFNYAGCAHWFAEEGSPNYDQKATELARTRVIGQLCV